MFRDGLTPNGESGIPVKNIPSLQAAVMPIPNRPLLGKTSKIGIQARIEARRVKTGKIIKAAGVKRMQITKDVVRAREAADWDREAKEITQEFTCPGDTPIEKPIVKEVVKPKTNLLPLAIAGVALLALTNK